MRLAVIRLFLGAVVGLIYRVPRMDKLYCHSIDYWGPMLEDQRNNSRKYLFKFVLNCSLASGIAATLLLNRTIQRSIVVKGFALSVGSMVVWSVIGVFLLAFVGGTLGLQ